MNLKELNECFAGTFYSGAREARNVFIWEDVRISDQLGEATY